MWWGANSQHSTTLIYHYHYLPHLGFLTWLASSQYETSRQTGPLSMGIAVIQSVIHVVEVFFPLTQYSIPWVSRVTDSHEGVGVAVWRPAPLMASNSNYFLLYKEFYWFSQRSHFFFLSLSFWLEMKVFQIFIISDGI